MSKSAAKHDLDIATNGLWHHPQPEYGVPKEVSATHHLLGGRSEHGIRHCEVSHRVGCYPVADIRLGQRQAGNDQQVLPELTLFLTQRPPTMTSGTMTSGTMTSGTMTSGTMTSGTMTRGTMRICFLFYRLASPSRTMSIVTAKSHTTISNNWESELVASARAIKDGSGRDDVTSSSEEDEGEDSPVIPLSTAWSHSTELLDYAVATNNPAMIALLSQARELIQHDRCKAIDSRRQTPLGAFVVHK